MNIYYGQRQRFFLIIILAVLLFITGCATEERAWNKAKEENSIWSYEEFLLKYPEGDYTEKAKLVLEEIYWQAALTTINEDKNRERHIVQDNYSIIIKVVRTETVEEYLDLFPEGKYVDEAREVLDEAAWWLAVEENTYAGYRDYLDKYPQGNYAREASRAVMFLSLSPVVNGQGVQEAADYNPDEPATHKLVILWESGAPHRESTVMKSQLATEYGWNEELPPHWVPSSINEVVLVVIIKSEWITVDTRRYTGGATVERKVHKIDIEVREAKTGAVVAEVQLWGGSPNQYPISLPAHQRWIFGSEVSCRDFEEWFLDMFES